MNSTDATHLTRPEPRGRRLLAAGVFGIALGVATAPAVGAETPSPAPDERSTGLPEHGHWTFNFDAGAGAFGFANSLYTNTRPDPSGDLSDDWAESFVKPALSARFPLTLGEVYGKVSAVGERTFAAPPPLVGAEASSFKTEDLYLGWRSGTSLGSSENLVDVTIGRAPYKIGHGMILWDGAGEGGSRGGFWSNARKAWAFAAVGRVKPKNHTFEAFYLNRDELPEADSSTEVWGANYELALGAKSTFGATYLKFNANEALRPERDGLNVYDFRAFTSPLRSVPDLALELEYAREENGDRLGSTGWTGQVSYELSQARWKPKVSYRYASFDGDDPTTTKNEGFDSLLPGFYDWGTWWQGEIVGEYLAANSNLQSSMLRLHVAPTETVGAGLMGYLFRLHEPTALGPHVQSKDVAFELDGYCDWKLNKAFTVSVVAAMADPKGAIEQAYGRTKTFTYGMAYVAYSY
jgi:hypothetical protein